MIGTNKMILNPATVMELIEESYNRTAMTQAEIDVTDIKKTTAGHFEITFHTRLDDEPT